MDVKLHTVGRITRGQYKDWYVFIQTYPNKSSYLILISNNKMFGKDEKNNLIEGSVGYDSWMPDQISLEHHFEVNGWEVEWLDDWTPEWLKDEAE